MNSEGTQNIKQILHKAIRWANNRQQHLLAELMQLEKSLNQFQDTKPSKKKIMIQEEEEKPIQKQIEPSLKYQKKIQAMIQQAQSQIESLNNPTKKSHKQNIQKIKKPEPLPQIQKKPPIPTNNRSKDPHSLVPKQNYHYRNKNQVTAKITQVSNNRTMPKIDRNTKQSFSSQKLPKNSVQTGKKVEKQQQKPQSKSVDKIKKQKITFVDFQSFKKPLKQLVSSCISQKGNEVFGKIEIQRLINEYDKQWLGYRQKEEQGCRKFLKSFSNLGASMRTIAVKEGLSIERRGWKGHGETFRFKHLLNYYRSLIQRNPISEEYRMDPKQAYKIKYTHKMINHIFQTRIQSARQNLTPPPKLGINFPITTSPDFDPSHIQTDQNNINPYTQQFYQLLRHRLSQIKNMQSLDRKSLSDLRQIICIGLFDGRRSPVIVRSEEFQQWKHFYNNQ